MSGLEGSMESIDVDYQTSLTDNIFLTNMANTVWFEGLIKPNSINFDGVC